MVLNAAVLTSPYVMTLLFRVYISYDVERIEVEYDEDCRATLS